MDHQDSILNFAAASRRQAIAVQVLTTLVVVGNCGVFLGGGLAFMGNPVGGTILLSAVPLLMFKPWLKRAQEKLRSERRQLVWHQNAADRIDQSWDGDGRDSSEFGSLMPLGEDQCGLFGATSLFEQVCTCETAPGRRRLAEWLAAPSSAPVVRERQSATKELAADLPFRRGFGVATMSFAGLGRLEALSSWLSSEGGEEGNNGRLALLVLMPLITLAAIVSLWMGWLSGMVGWSVTALAGAFHVWLGMSSGSVLGAIASDISQLIESDLQTIFGVLPVVAAKAWNADILLAVRSTVLTELVDSGAVAALMRAASLLSLANSEALWVLVTFFLVPQIAFNRLERWRSIYGQSTQNGIDGIADLDALVALGNYAAENPSYRFPRILGTSKASIPVLTAKGLGHPLMDEASCVCNDVSLNNSSRYWVISGSNMGGKSTLLRTIGLNLSLAWAGAPVRATEFVTSTGTVAGSISVGDALKKGQSHFGAEVCLLEKILRLVRLTPCVVLLDEILSGTNTGDRRVAAREIGRRLSEANTIGVITTHDLSVSDDLLELPSFEPRHFAATETANGLEFDYLVRPGVVSGTNGLAVLRMLGIDVYDGPAEAPSPL